MFYPDLADEGYLPHKISQLYVVGDAEPSIRVDITDAIDLKIQSILAHKTQIAAPEEAITRWKERWGEKQEDDTFRYYEHFRVLKFT
jgi:LmbE family N-acetylglucosaminyl deacetylase